MGKRAEEGRAGVRLALLAGLLAHALTVAAARAEPVDAAVVQKVEALLAAGAEPSEQRSVIVAMGAPGEQALMRVFERDEAPRYVRLRALSVLQSFRTESAARYFEALVRASAQDEPRLGALHPARSPMVLRRALQGLLETAQALQPPLAPEPVSACLAHGDPHVRKLAARLLATLDGAEVDRMLNARLARERSLMVRGTLQQQLASRSARRAVSR